MLSKLPPDYQPLANARLAMATRAADAPTILRGVAAAKLDEPAIKLERVQWLRRTGNLDDARALLAKPVAGQNDAWWNERSQVARDLLDAGRAADAYAVVVPHGLTKGVSFAEAEFLAGWIALRHLKKTADAQKHFQTLHDGVTTDISRSRAAYWLGRTHEAAGRAKDAGDWYGRASASARPSMASWRPASCRAAPRACRATRWLPMTTARRWAAASWRPWRAISARPATSSARGLSCCVWRAW